MATGPREWSPKVWVAIKVNAGHTTNGNPRRGWIVLDGRSGDMIDFVDEGYVGVSALKKAYPAAVESIEVAVTPGEYRELRKFESEQEKKHKRGEI